MPEWKVFVTRAIPDAGLDLLRGPCEVSVWPDDLPPPYDALRAAAAEVDGLLTLLSDRVDEALMEAAPRLKVISQMAVGYDNVNIHAAKRRGIRVGHTPGVLTNATADCAFALLLAAARRLDEAAEFVRAGRWLTWGPMLLMGQEVYGATLGIVGFGRIGQAVAQRARGFDMRVLYYDHAPSELPEGVRAESVSLDRLLAEADFVTLHVPLTSDTHHLIGAPQLRQMKRSAVLINTARGSIVDPVALYDALRSGVIAGAALDVTEPEPLPADHPLVRLPNCLVVPHIASSTVKTRTRMAEMAAENLLAGLRGEALPYPVPGSA